jgi:4-hydroxy-tetrahydrodipicolinate synthase
MSMTLLSGTGVALATPFKEDFSIDFESLEKLIKHVTKGKVEFLVVMGTTGESPTLSTDEQKQILQFVQDKNEAKLPVVFGIGGNSTKDIVNAVTTTDLTGVSAILSVAPYYNKPSQEGLYQHYKAIAQASDKPIILYNVPGRTACNISAETTLRLASDFKNIIAVKEASGDFVQIMDIIKNKPSNFSVISGDDALTFPIIALGGSGVITVAANAFPFEYSEMVRLALKGNFAESRALHYKLLDIINAQFDEGSPTGIKAILSALKICEQHVRMPLAPASEELRSKVIQLVSKI